MVEDNQRHAKLLRETIENAGQAAAGMYEVTHAVDLAGGIERLDGGGVDVVLLDLSLPDGGSGMEPLLRLREHSGDLPVIVLTGATDDQLAAQALQIGAADYLVKGKLTTDLLARAIRYAIQLNRLQFALKSLSFIDGLTNLFNRRGFVTLADPHMKIAQRNKGRLLFASVDVEGLNKINENVGRDAGDTALRETAEILRRTFRDSDVLARLEGGTFAALAIDASQDKSPIIANRLQQQVNSYNAQTVRGYDLRLRIGFVAFEPDAGVSIEDLMVKAAEARRGLTRSRRSSKRLRIQD